MENPEDGVSKTAECSGSQGLMDTKDKGKLTLRNNHMERKCEGAK